MFQKNVFAIYSSVDEFTQMCVYIMVSMLVCVSMGNLFQTWSLFWRALSHFHINCTTLNHYVVQTGRIIFASKYAPIDYV